VVAAALAGGEVGDGVGLQRPPLLEIAEEGVARLPAAHRLLRRATAVGCLGEFGQFHARLAADVALEEVRLQAQLLVFDAGQYADASSGRDAGGAWPACRRCCGSGKGDIQQTACSLSY
jgi:hypothetical protein